MTAARFEGRGEAALLCDRAEINGGVQCSCECIGATSFIAATIGGDLDCGKGVFTNPEAFCLNAAGATIKGKLFLRSGFQATGEVNLAGASVGNIVDCSNGTFTAGTRLTNHGFAVAATFDRLSCGAFFLNNARANGPLSIWGATIRGNLDLRGAHIVASPKDSRQIAIMADSAQIDGSLACDKDTKLMGALSITSSHIKGDLLCRELEFGSLRSKTLIADGLRVTGRAYLSNMHIRGVVSLIGASLDSGLYCYETEFDNPGGQCLNITDAIVKGGIFLRSAILRGNAVLRRVQVTGDVICESATFRNPGGVAVDLTGGKVAGTLVWREIAAEPGEIDLRNLRVTAVNDDAQSWLSRDVIQLQGMTYDLINVDPTSLVSAGDRVKWLQKQKSFSLQPYEILMRVLRNMGHDADARIIGIAKLRGLRNSGELRGWAWFFNYALDTLVGYGYQPAKPICH